MRRGEALPHVEQNRDVSELGPQAVQNTISLVPTYPGTPLILHRNNAIILGVR
jgi:hypothetical protein